jgi:hypothetical protein
VSGAGDDFHGGERVEDEPAGGDGGASGVQALDPGLVLFGEGVPGLAFYQAEDEQGQADDGDQGGDAPVALAEQGGDGEGALEGGVAALLRTRALPDAGENLRMLRNCPSICPSG